MGTGWDLKEGPRAPIPLKRKGMMTVRIAPVSSFDLYDVRLLKSGERLISGAYRAAGSLVATGQPTERLDVVPVNLAHKSAFSRQQEPRTFLIDIYV